jgi:glyoxylase-like metal-dependent hydrolase (beta-lactamase superfamily II)
VRQRAELIPVMSDGLAVPLVVDASTAGAATLPAWLSAGARFMLEAPSGCRAVVITDREPATAITPQLRGPTEVIRALTAVRPGGERDTAAALTLAARQFPQAGTGRRVVVMYTTAADADGPSAATLAARFRAGGTILVVIGTAGDGYWSDAAAATGGFFAPAGQPVVVPALDQVESTLSGRYLVSFATPGALPARVSVRVDAGDLTLTGDAVIPPPPPAAADGSATSRTLLWPAAVTVVVAAVAALTLLLALRSRRPREPVGPPALTAVFRGRAAVPGPAARGRARIPLDVRKRPALRQGPAALPPAQQAMPIALPSAWQTEPDASPGTRQALPIALPTAWQTQPPVPRAMPIALPSAPPAEPDETDPADHSDDARPAEQHKDRPTN